jgi:predicted Holliday junction resolvase-like endonuclease
MLEYLIVVLLVVILLGVVFLGISLRKRKETAEIDATKLSEDISARIREDVSKAVRETVSEVSERVGGVSNTLKSTVELFEKMSKELPKDVKEPMSEVLDRTLRDLREFDKNIDEMGKKLPNKVLRSIQTSISVRKGKVGELATLMSLLGEYKRIIPLGQPIDFIGVSDDYIDFIEVKTGTAGLSPVEREIKEMIEKGKVRFILRKEDVEIIMPEEIEVEKFKTENDDEVKGTESVIFKFGESKDPKVIPRLIAFTKSKDGNERRLAASALGKLSVFKPQILEAVQPLIELLEDENPQVRQYSAKALGKIGGKDAIPYLKQLMNDKKEYVRSAAKLAISQIEGEVRELRGEISVCINCGESISGEFDVCPYCSEPLIK